MKATTIPHNHLRMALQRIADRKTYQGRVLTPQDMRRGAEAVSLPVNYCDWCGCSGGNGSVLLIGATKSSPCPNCSDNPNEL